MREHYDTLSRVANALIVREKISGEEFERLFEGAPLDDKPSDEPRTAEAQKRAQFCPAPEQTEQAADAVKQETKQNETNHTEEKKQEE